MWISHAKVEIISQTAEKTGDFWCIGLVFLDLFAMAMANAGMANG